MLAAGTSVRPHISLGTGAHPPPTHPPHTHTTRERERERKSPQLEDGRFLSLPLSLHQPLLVGRPEASSALYSASGGGVGEGWGHATALQVTELSYLPATVKDRADCACAK